MPEADATAEFLSRLAVQPDGEDRFTGICHPAWPGRAFGGQIAAKALQAAAATASHAAMEPLSIHVCFHAPVASGEPASYEVERLKDGRTLASRRVRVSQDGRLGATATVQLGVPGDGPMHQWRMPDEPPPSELQAEERLLDPAVVPVDADYEALGYPSHSRVDLRVIHDDPSGDHTRRPVWMRVTVDLPDDALTSASTLCYLSDITLGTTVLEPHGGRSASGDLQLGAMELALWFTRPVPAQEWLLFGVGSSFAGGGHSLAHGVIYDADGDVVGMAVQNALMRTARPH